MSGVGCAPRQRTARARREAGIDPVCHTLLGAGLARCGLARRTAFGASTLIIGANLPDVDVLSYLWGPAADLAFRRGWTHGVLALALWPFLLTGVMLLVERRIRLRRKAEVATAAIPGQLLLLSTVAVLSHPILDTLNTYGVRWLMPFSGRWFYGDTLFIVDPWMWLLLGAGVLLSRRGTRPARLALGVAAGYVLTMVISGAAARRATRREVERFGQPVTALMLSPQPITPFARTVVAARQGDYLVGPFRWLETPPVHPEVLRSFPRGDVKHPAAVAAAASTVGRRFLSWARFPSFRIEPSGTNGYMVHIVDLRYTDRPGVSFGSVSIPVRTASTGGGSLDSSGTRSRQLGGRLGQQALDVPNLLVHKAPGQQEKRRPIDQGAAHRHDQDVRTATGEPAMAPIIAR
jgi:inner membrane protein